MVQHVTAMYSAQDAFTAIKQSSKSHERNEKEDVLFWVWNALYHLQDISTMFAEDPRPPRLQVFDSTLHHIFLCNCVG